MNLPGLTADQAAFVHQEIGDVVLVDDMSWGLIDTAVLHVRADGTDLSVKAAGEGNHHIRREITAHETATAPWLGLPGERCPRLVAASPRLTCWSRHGSPAS